MISIATEVSIEKLLASGFGTSARRFHCDKYSVDFCQHSRIVNFQGPAVLVLVVQVEDTEAPGDLLRGLFVSPSLEGMGSC